MRTPEVDAYIQAVREVERKLIEQIEEIEGRVPTNAEVAKFGERVTDATSFKTTYTWKGTPIVSLQILPTGIMVRARK